MHQGILVVLVLSLIHQGYGQKLFFKSKGEQSQGFGLKEAPNYFTSRRTALEMDSKVSEEVVCPGKQSACPTGNTCCLMVNKAYGCCPLPQAACCQDGRHCCPMGMKCDIMKQACTYNDISISWSQFEKESYTLDADNNSSEHGIVKVKDESVICPDGQSECPNDNTCCKLATGQWGCCPKPNAVCCSDHVHCCPSGTTCDVAHGKCNQGNIQIDWFKKQPAITKENVQCDATHECPSGNTCCMLASGEWGCCPIPDAVCCSDHVHCCPSGTTCDAGQGKCNKGNIQIDWFKKQPAITKENVQCDATHECPSGNTCCMLASGEWGCCPIPDAVCCSDHVHCCPSGTTCDAGQGKCNKGNIQIDWFKKQPAITKENVQCDATHECPSGNTCCMLASGEWGCCPIPDAVCCSDHVHCCPSGTTCDAGQGKCNKGNIQIDWFKKQPAITKENVQCDATHECPSGNTCCMLASGEWGCCPIPDAVCCSDHVHCCPSGTTCDAGQGKCNKGNIQIDWFKKQPAITKENVQCDATHECPSGNTCCMLASGEWGCCPIPDAVCCSDHVHCCPSGTTCDAGQGKCNKGNIQIDWFKKQPAITKENVQCDATHECPSGNTCCMLASGEWGCCPIPDAVCCSDHVHCCPSGTTCDAGQGKCNKGNIQIDWFKKQPAITKENVQCDATHECPSGNTCCMLASGEWGCCPIPDAVCCSDNIHCCPSGTTCDVGQGKCNRGNIQIDWFKKQPAITVENVQCDATHECPSGNTCCKQASGEWGCCPIQDAVCCVDQVHCCPSSTTCDLTHGKCDPGSQQMALFEKQPAINVKSGHCNATHHCPKGNTCCKPSPVPWECCPFSNAVCCSDHLHCCPSGYKCDVGAGTCNRGNQQIDWLMKQPAIPGQSVQCDGSHECPTGNTCCKLTSGQWGCCPIPNAVCCSDHVHCCPSGTTCNVGQGKCNKGNIQIDWFEKQPAITVETVQCDATHECPSGNTCCKLASGLWGCCPILNAVCCSDHVHCCPSGTTCDVGQGKCNQGNIQIDWFEKQPAITVENVQCDATHECPSGNTCCMLASGQWGCCPIPNAVCCSDHVHCCPSGTTCNVGQGKCNKGNIQIDWFKKQPAITVETVQCDATHECPSGSTCCKLASGQWGCCPIPDAVCCSDHVHCCPSGTSCDVSKGTCSDGNIQIDWLQKTSAISTTGGVSDVICPDGSECMDGQTCCQMDGGRKSYGCCPLPNAVCCSDGLHCCPAGYKCNTGARFCIKGSLNLPWISTQSHFDTSSATFQLANGMVPEFVKVKEVDVETVVDKKDDVDVGPGTGPVKCAGGSVTCPEEHTCCSNVQGSYSCCPMPMAICCVDKVNCCPHGYICGEEPGTCRIPEMSKATSELLRRLTLKKGRKHT